MAREHMRHDRIGHSLAVHDHASMVADFRRGFWVSLVLTVPVLALSPLIQNLLGLQQALAFSGASYVLFGFSAVVFFYGGWPFLTGFTSEVSSRRPGMMTLIATAITVAFVYSSAVVFGLAGKVFFWKLVTLIDIMLLGHWIEMKSVMGASRALEALVQLLPATAHRLKANDEAEDVPVAELKPGDHVLVKPGERVPMDGIITKGRSSFDEALVHGLNYKDRSEDAGRWLDTMGDPYAHRRRSRRTGSHRRGRLRCARDLRCRSQRPYRLQAYRADFTAGTEPDHSAAHH
jgi:P-type Cu2+ transporter